MPQHITVSNQVEDSSITHQAKHFYKSFNSSLDVYGFCNETARSWSDSLNLKEDVLFFLREKWKQSCLTKCVSHIIQSAASGVEESIMLVNYIPISDF